jgi:hypothetical protein
MKIFEIKTTSDNDSNFYLMTDINRITIELVIEKMVKDERAEGSDIFYMNEDYVGALRKMFPKAVLIHYERIPLIEI